MLYGCLWSAVRESWGCLSCYFGLADRYSQPGKEHYASQVVPALGALPSGVVVDFNNV